MSVRIGLCRCLHYTREHRKRGPGLYGACTVYLCACEEFAGV